MKIHKKGEYSFIDEGQGEPLVLLHGLFGALSNWESVVGKFSQEYRVLIPLLPIYEMPIKKAGLDALTDFTEGFVDMMGLDQMTLIGNSLGGHVALIYTLRHPEQIKDLYSQEVLAYLKILWVVLSQKEEVMIILKKE